MEIKQIEAAIEAILFASGEPISSERIATVLEIDRGTVLKILSLMAERTNATQGGLRIIKIDDSFQYTTRPEFSAYIRKALDIKRNVPLSQAAMEALSIIAYNQPVTKGYIEQVRGVDCSGIVSSLLTKGLIEERGRLDVLGRPILYGTTLDFLRCFGISSLKDLPPVEEKKDDERQKVRTDLPHAIYHYRGCFFVNSAAVKPACTHCCFI
jgi:segregation and condensation protein B